MYILLVVSIHIATGRPEVETAGTPLNAKNIYRTEHTAYKGEEQHMETGLIICVRWNASGRSF
jgi:hypothetical protein